MGKGTPAMGPKGKKSAYVILCRRCGGRSYRVKSGECSHCGYGKSAKMRSYAWQTQKNGKTKRMKQR